MTNKRADTIAGIFALLIIVVAWYIGTQRAIEDIIPHLESACKEAPFIKKRESNIFEAFESESNSSPYAWLLINSASGYGGELISITVISPEGKISGTSIIDHKETSSFFKKVERKHFSKQFENKSVTDKFIIDEDIDIVSGATFTSKAYSESVRKSAYQAGREILGLEVPPEPVSRIVFGKHEIVWLVFLLLAVLSVSIKSKRTQMIRWIMMIAGMVLIGFVYNIPLSTGLINKALLGFWPSLGDQFYFYIMLSGVFLIILISNKNLYYDRICPFGAVQECVALISGTKRQYPVRYRLFFIWIQRLIALGLIVVALVMRKPGYANYEVFGTMFHLTGNVLQFSLLIIFLLLSLIIVRPWCNYLCPVKPVTDYARMVRRWGRLIKIKDKR